MQNLKTTITLTALMLGLGLPPNTLAQEATAAPASDPALDAGNLRAFIALARADLNTEKTHILAQNISFTEDEAFEFWPLHSEYNLELNKLLDVRLELLSEYARTYQNMTNQQATKFAGKVFDLEAKRTALKRKWFKKFS